MNEYRMKELAVGQTEQFKVTVTEKMMKQFLEITGDTNPMHTDESYASKMGWGGVILYGMCTASFYSTLVGVYIPGKYCLLQKCEVEWPAPVYLGDTLTVRGTIREVDEKNSRIFLYADIRNQDGLKVSRARLTVGVWEE